PAAPVDRSDGGPVEVDDVRGHGRRVVGVASEGAGPAAADPRDLVAFLGGAGRRGLDARVQARDVAAAGQDADLHARLRSSKNSSPTATSSSGTGRRFAASG